MLIQPIMLTGFPILSADEGQPGDIFEGSEISESAIADCGVLEQGS
ncbi:hypothetical protein CFII64_02616 [Pseudomonas sp. CFII64]|jgi:hypothetical protein|nr:hypothetical protein CFII64_02616 [Pseudomonas sp. CFII64]